MMFLGVRWNIGRRRRTCCLIRLSGILFGVNVLIFSKAIREGTQEESLGFNTSCAEFVPRRCSLRKWARWWTGLRREPWSAWTETSSGDLSERPHATTPSSSCSRPCSPRGSVECAGEETHRMSYFHCGLAVFRTLEANSEYVCDYAA